MKRISYIFAVAAALVLSPSMVMANAGVPMLFITLPAMVIALIPIIVIEMAIMKTVLNSTWHKAGYVSLIANAASTFVGVPLAWVGFMIIEMVVGVPVGYMNIDPGPILGTILFAAWLSPDEKSAGWMIPFASMVLLVGYFYVSYWSEKIIAQRLLKDQPPERVGIATWRANCVSYALLEMVAAGFLVYATFLRNVGI